MELFDKAKKWASDNRVVAGALTGGAAGSIIPGAGTIAGALGGALVGFLSSKENASSTDAAPADDKAAKKK